jgi:hypothetical protein
MEIVDSVASWVLCFAILWYMFVYDPDKKE